MCAKEAPRVASHKGEKAAGGKGNLGCPFHLSSNGSHHPGEKLHRKPLPVSAAWLMGNLSTPEQYVMVLYLDAFSLPLPHRWWWKPPNLSLRKSTWVYGKGQLSAVERAADWAVVTDLVCGSGLHWWRSLHPALSDAPAFQRWLADVADVFGCPVCSSFRPWRKKKKKKELDLHLKKKNKTVWKICCLKSTSI